MLMMVAVVAFTVSQLSISPENTIFNFLHLDVGEVGGFVLFFSKIIFKKSCLGRVSGAPCASVWPISHSSAGQHQVKIFTIFSFTYMIFLFFYHHGPPLPLLL